LALGLLALGLLAFLPNQLHTLDNRDGHRFARYLAALAIELKTEDGPRIEAVLPYANKTLLSYAERAAAQDLSVFGTPLLRDAGTEIGDVATKRGRDDCPGAVDAVTPLGEESRYAKVEGWVLVPALADNLALVRFIDADGRIAGFALSGVWRPDVAAALGTPKKHAGFSGYILKSAANGPFSYGARGGGCEAVYAP
ncbi:MAG: hypothetical protein AB7P23_13465, partial [Amphiplicatus sp.]